jgi:hypothetical protein
MRGRNGERAIDPVDARATKQEQVSLHSQALSGQAGKGLEFHEKQKISIVPDSSGSGAIRRAPPPL